VRDPPLAVHQAPARMKFQPLSKPPSIPKGLNAALRLNVSKHSNDAWGSVSFARRVTARETAAPEVIKVVSSNK
jgi:hypothetical protein